MGIEQSVEEIRKEVEKNPTTAGFYRLSRFYLNEYEYYKNQNRTYAHDCIFEAIRLADKAEKCAKKESVDIDMNYSKLAELYGLLTDTLSKSEEISSGHYRAVKAKEKRYMGGPKLQTRIMRVCNRLFRRKSPRTV